MWESAPSGLRHVESSWPVLIHAPHWRLPLYNTCSSQYMILTLQAPSHYRLPYSTMVHAKLQWQTLHYNSKHYPTVLEPQWLSRQDFWLWRLPIRAYVDYDYRLIAIIADVAIIARIVIQLQLDVIIIAIIQCPKITYITKLYNKLPKATIKCPKLHYSAQHYT